MKTVLAIIMLMSILCACTKSTHNEYRLFISTTEKPFGEFAYSDEDVFIWINNNPICILYGDSMMMP